MGVLDIAKANEHDLSCFFPDNDPQIKSPLSLSKTLDHPEKLKAIIEHKSRFT